MRRLHIGSRTVPPADCPPGAVPCVHARKERMLSRTDNDTLTDHDKYKYFNELGQVPKEVGFVGGGDTPPSRDEARPEIEQGGRTGASERETSPEDPLAGEHLSSEDERRSLIRELASAGPSGVMGWAPEPSEERRSYWPGPDGRLHCSAVYCGVNSTSKGGGGLP
jgi:hypothetical protein